MAEHLLKPHLMVAQLRDSAMIYFAEFVSALIIAISAIVTVIAAIAVAVAAAFAAGELAFNSVVIVLAAIVTTAIKAVADSVINILAAA